MYTLDPTIKYACGWGLKVGGKVNEIIICRPLCGMVYVGREEVEGTGV